MAAKLRHHIIERYRWQSGITFFKFFKFQYDVVFHIPVMARRSNATRVGTRRLKRTGAVEAPEAPVIPTDQYDLTERVRAQQAPPTPPHTPPCS